MRKNLHFVIFVVALVSGFAAVWVIRQAVGRPSEEPTFAEIRAEELRKLGPLQTLVLPQEPSAEPEASPAEPAPKPLPPARVEATPAKAPFKLARLQKGSIEEEQSSPGGSQAFHVPDPEQLNVPMGFYEIARAATQDVLKAKNGTLAYNGRMYGATATGSGVQVALPFTVAELGRPRFSMDLAQVSVNNVVLPREAAEPVPAPEDRGVKYGRGSFVEEYTFRPDAVEQTVRFEKLPARGDIVITMPVKTNLTAPPNGTKRSQLDFTHEGAPLITVSHALAFDAEGRTIQLELVYESGNVSLTVPAYWVAQAALPLYVDPLIGAPVNVDGSVNPSFQLLDHYCDVIYNSSSKEWLVVWSEPHGASAFDDDLFAQRIRSDGRLMGGVITIDARTSGAYEMAVSYASSVNRYLVAWRTDPLDNGSLNDGRIDARVVNANGTFFTGIFTVGDFPEADMLPASACDGSNFYVTWQHLPSVGIDRNIYGRFVTRDGVLGAFVHPDTDVNASQNPRVSYNSSAKTFMIVWRKTVAGLWGVSARILDGMTQTFLTAPFTVEGETGAMYPDVSAGGSKFLIVWNHFYNRGIYGRLNTTGTTASMPAGKFAIRTGANEATFARADYSTTSQQWYVVSTDPVIANELGGSKVTLAGALDGFERLTYNSVAETAPAIAWNSSTNEMLVAYRRGNSPYTIQAQRIGFPSAKLYALVSPPGQSELLRYDRGTITRTLLAGTPLLHGVSKDYVAFLMKMSNGWRLKTFNRSTGAAVHEVNSSACLVAQSHWGATENIVLQGTIAFFPAQLADFSEAVARVDLVARTVALFAVPMKSRGVSQIFPMPDRIGVHFWPDDLLSRPVGRFNPTGNTYADLLTRANTDVGGRCFFLPEMGLFGSNEHLATAGQLVQHTDVLSNPLAAPVVHPLNTFLRKPLPGVYQNKQAILYGEGVLESDVFKGLVIYNPVTRTQLVRRVLTFEAGDMKASPDFTSVILTDTTTPGIVEFRPGVSPEFRRLVDLTNFTIAVNVVTAP